MSSHKVVVTQAAKAENIDLSPDNVHLLLADGPDTGGALTGHRVRLSPGGKGAVPHRHDHSSEAFYVISGRAEVLIGDRVIAGEEGDFIVVPPGTAHAFAAAPGHPADLLIVLSPGVARFDYFRHLADIHGGRRARDSLDAVQERFDTHFVVSPAWHGRRHQ